jgi:hypothetical protein
MSLYQRLVANSVKPDDQTENGCWIWTGALNNSGYGRYPYRTTIDTVDEWGQPVRLKKVRHRLAHRVMEQLQRRNVAQLAADLAAEEWLLGAAVELADMDPDTETIEHLCACRRCICPDHWIVVTRAENTALMRKRIGK